jgi:hypothetical protein
VLLDAVVELERLPEMGDRVLGAAEARLHARGVEEHECLGPLRQYRPE